MITVTEMSIEEKFDLLTPEEQQEVLRLVHVLAQAHQPNSPPVSVPQP